MQSKLTAIQVRQAKEPGKYFDGDGLVLIITKTGAKKWVYRYQIGGTRREMGLGTADDVSLADAREAKRKAKELIRAGVDPIDQREQERRAEEARKAEEARQAEEANPTFKWCALEYIKRHAQGWSNPKHVAQWESTLKTYAFPVVGKLPVSDVQQHHIVRILDPLWGSRTETASRLRGRIERVLSWAAVMGYRSHDNPAQWRGRLATLFPARQKAQPTKHHPALPYPQLPAFMARLREHKTMAALTLEFQILTATRSSETRGAQWGEFDLEARTWTIPGARMKARKPHRVPLCDRALEIVAGLHEVGRYVFAPTGKGGISETAVRVLLGSLDPDITSHGFRSTFRDWASEQTAYPHEVCEQALAHTITSAVERAYRRGDLFEKRRQLMAAWADFCTAPAQTGDVIPIRAKA